MALLGNYSVLLKSAGRFFGGATVSDNRAAKNTSGSNRNFLTAGINQYTSFPDGYAPGSALRIAQKTGGIASRTQVVGSGAVNALNLAGGLNADAALTGTGDITNADIVWLIVAAAALTGAGVFTADMTATIAGEAALSGSGEITDAALNSILNAVAALTGTGEITDAGMVGAIAAAAALTGTGDVAGGIAGAISAVANLTGTGGISANIEAIWNMACNLYGTGELTGDVTALAHLVSALTGAGDVTNAGILAKAYMSADITVTGDLLTTANVGSSVWGALSAVNDESGTMGEKMNDAGSASNPWTEVIESGYTAEEILRILFAFAAGQSDGGGTATIHFRDQADTKDRIAATVDGSGNRSAITLDPS